MNDTQEKTESDLLYEYLERRCEEFGALITYEELGMVLGRDLREKNRAPLYTAKRRLEKSKHRSLRCVRGRGYRVPPANEHVDMADSRWGRAGKQLAKAQGELNGTDLAALSAEEVRRHDSATRQNAALRAEVRRHRKILARHEEWLSSLDNRVDRLERKPVPAVAQDDIRRMIAEELERRATGE